MEDPGVEEVKDRIVSTILFKVEVKEGSCLVRDSDKSNKEESVPIYKQTKELVQLSF